MPKNSQVNWRKQEVMVKVDKATDEAMTALAFQILGYAEVNIVSANLVDTGFMLNSGYVVSPDSDTYGQAVAEAGSKNSKAEAAPKRDRQGAKAIVAFAAAYTIYNEERAGFIYRAAQQGARDAKATVEPVYRKEIGD